MPADPPYIGFGSLDVRHVTREGRKEIQIRCHTLKIVLLCFLFCILCIIIGVLQDVPERQLPLRIPAIIGLVCGLLCILLALRFWRRDREVSGFTILVGISMIIF